VKNALFISLAVVQFNMFLLSFFSPEKDTSSIGKTFVDELLPKVKGLKVLTAEEEVNVPAVLVPEGALLGILSQSVPSKCAILKFQLLQSHQYHRCLYPTIHMC